MKRIVKAFLASAIPAIIAVLLSTQADEVICAGPLSLKKRSLSAAEGIRWYDHPDITENPIHQGQITQDFVNHVKPSPKCNELRFVGAIQTKIRDGSKAEVKSDTGGVRSSLEEKLNEPGLQGLRNAAQLESAVNPGKFDKIIATVQSETAEALAIAGKYAEAVERGDYAVILDNEGDDLAYLWMTFEDGKIPKVIITYGGYTELRFRAVEEFVTALCDRLNILEHKRPKVYKGFAHPYPKGKERATYDAMEGVGYINDNLRKKYIAQSEALEKKLDFKSQNWMDHDEFSEGIKALGKLIDDSESKYTAIAVLTCPAAVAHVIKQNPERASKIGVTMSSPWAYSIRKDGFRYESTFNSNRQITMMNYLLTTGVDFLGVGGGTAKTKGMRTIHDAQHGNGEGQSQIYGEKGLENLEKVVSTKVERPKFLRIIAHAGENVATSKWKDWDIDFQQLWAHLGLKDPKHDGLEKLRKAVGTGIKSSKSPRVLEWNLDKVLSLFKLWVVWKNPVEWQAPSADLHAVITTNKKYIEGQGITGAARYAAGTVPVSDTRGPELVNFIKTNAKDKVYYSITDMDLLKIRDNFQEILNKYAV